MNKEQSLGQHLGDYLIELLDKSSSSEPYPLVKPLRAVEAELLDYLDPVEKRDEELVRLEELTHRTAITPWIQNHVTESKGLVSDTGYDPINKRWQRLDVGHTPVRPIPSFFPDRLVISRIERKIVKAIGSKATLHAMIDILQNTQAYEGARLSVGEEFERMILNDEHLVILSDHLEKGDLRDIALLVGGLICATGNIDLRKHVDVVLGKNIGRQRMGDMEVVAAITAAMGILWTMQNSDKRKSFDFPPETVRIIAHNFKRALESRKSEGGHAVAVVPSGTTTTKVLGKNGDEIYERKDVSPTVGIMRWSDAALPVAYQRGRVIPGPFHYPSIESPGSSRKVRGEAGERMIYKALQHLASGAAELTGTPMRYQRSRTEIDIAYPHSK